MSAEKQESEIAAKIKEIEETFQKIEFTFGTYEAQYNILLKSSNANEIIAIIEDSLTYLSTLKSIKFAEQFKGKIDNLIKKLTISKSVIIEWLKLQSLFILLKPIFSRDDIKEFLPKEVKKFSQINKNWVALMKNANETKNVISICYENEGIEKFIIHLQNQILECQDSLSSYLEKKREAFPRFYFVTDEILLEIIGTESDLYSIQPYLLHIFDNISHLDFDYLTYNQINGFRSKSDEIVYLKKPFNANGYTEEWLNEFIGVMRQTLRDSCNEMVQQMMTFDAEQWIDEKYPSQILTLSLLLWCTYRTEDALRKAKGNNRKIMQETLNEFEKRFKDLIESRNNVEKHDNHIKYIHADVLITHFLNNLDIYRQLYQDGIMSPNHIDWQCQMRYYWELDKNNCIVSIGDIEREYSFEYFGTSSRLVITPFTNKCFASFSQALNSFLAVSVVGPPGTGKVETIKDLAKSFGLFCIVFNCSDQMNHQIIGNFLKGLAEAGVWGCFDEFNRIKLDLLSVASKQIECILNACREKAKTFKFSDGKNIKIDNKAGIFISINPNYRDGQEIPESLRNEFRMIEMIPPDKRLFIRFALARSGFTHYDELSYNFASLYQLCSEKLSKQAQNIWNFSNIAFISNFLNEFLAENVIEDESQFLMCVLKNMNLSRLTDDDKLLFLRFLTDSFKGVQIELINDEIVQKAVDQYKESSK